MLRRTLCLAKLRRKRYVFTVLIITSICMLKLTMTLHYYVHQARLEPIVLDLAAGVITEHVKPLLTLATVIHDDPIRKEIHHRTINNWVKLSPWIRPVLFVDASGDNTQWGRIAQEKGWIVHKLDAHAMRNGVPMIRDIFVRLQDISSTPYIGYANADVLFDDNLNATLTYIDHAKHIISRKPIMVVGRRRNANVTVHNLGDGGDLLRVNRLAENLKLFKVQAMDYFIMSRGSYQWNHIPDFVVGRIGYDNWLVGKVMGRNHTVIDASRTINCVHQTGEDGNTSGFDNHPLDRYANMELMRTDPDFRCILDRGRSICAPIISQCTNTRSSNNTSCNVALFRRINIKSYCSKCLERSLKVGLANITNTQK